VLLVLADVDCEQALMQWCETVMKLVLNYSYL